jgi:hypothetical protein
LPEVWPVNSNATGPSCRFKYTIHVLLPITLGNNPVEPTNLISGYQLAYSKYKDLNYCCNKGKAAIESCG